MVVMKWMDESGDTYVHSEGLCRDRARLGSGVIFAIRRPL